MRTERVALEIPRHVQPVDAAHIFAPAEDLADEALGCRERRAPRAVRGLDGGDHLARVEQLEVERGRDA